MTEARERSAKLSTSEYASLPLIVKLKNEKSHCFPRRSVLSSLINIAAASSHNRRKHIRHLPKLEKIESSKHNPHRDEEEEEEEGKRKTRRELRISEISPVRRILTIVHTHSIVPHLNNTSNRYSEIFWVEKVR